MVMPGSNGWLLIRAKWWHQLSSTRSTSTARPSITAWKFSLRSRCQPGRKLAAKSSVVGWLPRTPTAPGVRWNTYRCCDDSASGGMAWMALAPVPMIPTTLSASFVMWVSSGPPPVYS